MPSLRSNLWCSVLSSQSTGTDCPTPIFSYHKWLTLTELWLGAQHCTKPRTTVASFRKLLCLAEVHVEKKFSFYRSSAHWAWPNISHWQQTPQEGTPVQVLVSCWCLPLAYLKPQSQILLHFLAQARPEAPVLQQGGGMFLIHHLLLCVF